MARMDSGLSTQDSLKALDFPDLSTENPHNSLVWNPKNLIFSISISTLNFPLANPFYSSYHLSLYIYVVNLLFLLPLLLF